MKRDRVLSTVLGLGVIALAGARARAAVGTCDTAQPVEIEATAGTPGPTGYATLGAAFAALNAGTHQGTVNVEICASVVMRAIGRRALDRVRKSESRSPSRRHARVLLDRPFPDAPCHEPPPA